MDQRTFLVGLRCSEWNDGCDCSSYVDDDCKKYFHEKFNCMYEDACYYLVVKADNAEQITMDLIKNQMQFNAIDKSLLNILKYDDFYIVCEGTLYNEDIKQKEDKN